MSNSAALRQESDFSNAAWVMAFGDGLHAAVGEFELLHLSAEVRLFEIPGSPFHCRHVCIWNDELLPVMDIHAWLTGRTLPHRQPLVGVVGYERGLAVDVNTATVQLGGLLLPSLPKRFFVGEDQACGLPENDLDWQAISISCFADERGGPIPILDLPRIFSDALISSDKNNMRGEGALSDSKSS